MPTRKSPLRNLRSIAWAGLIFSSAPLSAAIGAEPLIALSRDAVNSVTIVSDGQFFEPEQNISAGGATRHVADYRITAVWSPGGAELAERWRLDTHYPFDNDLTFGATYHETRGFRQGVDGFRPSAEGPVAAARIGAEFKDVWLSNPHILLAFADTAPIRHRSVYRFSAFDTEWELEADPETGLPTEVRTSENDPLRGSVVNRVVYSDWREVGGVFFPFRLEQFVDDYVIRREWRTDIRVNAADAEEELALPEGAPDEAVDPETRRRGWDMSHFYLRRAALGAPADRDQTANVTFDDLGDGLFQITGGSHHNLVIVGSEGLAIVDAVWHPSRSETILAEMKNRWPDKPLKYVILTHHHIDHVGGLVPFVKAGAQTVTSAMNAPYFEAILKKRVGRRVTVLAQPDRAVLAGLGREVETYVIPNSHAQGALAVYLPEEKLLYNTDLYSPGRPLQFNLWAYELLRATEFYGLEIERHVGGHGGGLKPHQDLLDVTAQFQ